MGSQGNRGYLRGRLIGRLTGFQNADKGYAWLMTGKNDPQYFVARSDVPPEAWFEGSIIEFTPAPPKPGKISMRAVNIIPRNQEAHKENHGEDLRSQQLA